jgi:hypothetical protein
MSLTDLFLAALYGSKTRLTCQDEHAHIRFSFESWLSDMYSDSHEELQWDDNKMIVILIIR